MSKNTPIKFVKSGYSWYFPLLISILLLIGGVAGFYVYGKVNNSNAESLVKRADTIALSLDAEEVSILSGSEFDLGSISYESLKQKLTKIREANEDSRFVYIVGKRGEQVFFYVDSESPESEDYSPPGEVYEDESPAFNNAFGEGLSGFEGPIIDSFGTWVTGVAPIRDRDTDEIVGVVGIDIDATNYKKDSFTYASIPVLLSLILTLFAYIGLRMHKAEETLLELKSKFVAVASHELRSPLTGLSWASDTLTKDATLSSSHKKIVGEICDTTKKLLETVNDILDAAVSEANTLQDQEKVDLHDAINESVSELKLLAQDKNVSLNVDVPKDAMLVKGNKGKLTRAIRNVLSNAIKYSPNQSAVTLNVTKLRKEFLIKITDKGIGIPKSEQEKILTGFYRGSNAKKFTETGTGLGMYLVQRIVKAHNGEISLESEEGQGTCVSITLPETK